MSGLPWRGIVEGFYGEPWSFDERIRMFGFAASVGLDRYLYAPKSDPWHRERWREPYPDDEAARLGALARAAEAAGVQFSYAISPGLSMRYADDADHRALAAKCRQLWDAGVRSFALLFDDVPYELQSDADRARFGDGAEATGRAHGHTAARFRDGFLAQHGLIEPLVFCPTDYAGVAHSPYRAGLAAELPPDARILWTGADIVVAEVSRDDVVRAVESYGRQVILWDNFPVNDFDRSRLFLGPLTGRTTDAEGSGLLGIAANPMVEAAASRFALSSVGDWALDPSGYDPRDAAGRAFERVAPDAPGLRTLVEACSAWPPSAPRWQELADAVSPGEPASLRRARSGRRSSSRRRSTARGSSSRPWPPRTRTARPQTWPLSSRPGSQRRPPPVRRGCSPAGSSAGSADGPSQRRRSWPPGATWSPTTPTWRATEVLALIDSAIVALGGAPVDAGDHRDGADVTILTGANPTPGDRELAEFLGSAGLRCTIRVSLPEDVHPDLVVVTASADEASAVDAARRTSAVVAWGHLVALGLATRSSAALSLDSVRITDPEHPAADGLSDVVPVYRGRSRLTWALPGPEAAVVARDVESEHPVIAHYPAGARLADGSEAPASRATLFLGADGFAPWLVTPEARALVLATVRAALA